MVAGIIQITLFFHSVYTNVNLWDLISVRPFGPFFFTFLLAGSVGMDGMVGLFLITVCYWVVD